MSNQTIAKHTYEFHVRKKLLRLSSVAHIYDSEVHMIVGYINADGSGNISNNVCIAINSFVQHNYE